MLNKQEIISLVEQHTAFDEQEQLDVAAVLSFLNKYEDCFSRANLKGQISVSAFVVTEDFEQLVMVHHKKIGKWFQPGGHTEPEDVSVEAAARREVEEETGLVDIQRVGNGIFDIYVHIIAEHNRVPEHTHYGIRFLFTTKDTKLFINTESNHIAWVDVQKMHEHNSEAAMFRVQKKILTHKVN